MKQRKRSMEIRPPSLARRSALMFAVALGLVLPVWAGPRILGLRRAAAAGSTAQATAMGISETMAQGTESHRPADLHTEAVLVASATPTPTPTPAPTSTPKPPPATKFFTVAPCRVADTRSTTRRVLPGRGALARLLPSSHVRTLT